MTLWEPYVATATEQIAALFPGIMDVTRDSINGIVRREIAKAVERCVVDAVAELSQPEDGRKVRRNGHSSGDSIEHH